MFSLNAHSYAWHENLGIDNIKAAELYQTKPNDPAIVQWKNALQLAINNANNCFNIESAIRCQILISTITSNCESHPNELLACNDSRFGQFPSILKQAQEAQIKAEEEKKMAEEEQRKAEKARGEEIRKTRSIQIQAYGDDMLDKCFNSLNTTSKLEVTGRLPCDIEMSSLQIECQLGNNTYNYCKDERFVGYLKEHKILNSTVSP
jgi:hypothetical protein